jgi:oligopeptide/dipeptide ABC transporter ATP-binding protein
VNDPILEVSQVHTSIPTSRGVVRAVDGVSFEVRSGEILGIVGESGCGKSMIALSIMRLVPPPGRIVRGRIVFKGTNVLDLDERTMRTIRGRQISMVFQEPLMSLNPILSCGAQICEVLMIHQNLPRRTAWRRAVATLEEVGIPSPEERARQYPHQLSGGMQQRVMIAMALACRPSLLIADEPTTALDVTIQAQILSLLKEMKKRLRMSCIMITHDFGVVADIAERIVVLYAGRVVEQARTVDLFEHPLHPYTKGLLQSIPTLDESGDRLRAIPGAVPNGVSLPKGCHFHPRCSHCIPVCREREPELHEVAHERSVRCWLSPGGPQS